MPRHNHAHVEFYKITHNPGFNDFLISPNLITEGEKALRFVYKQNGEDVVKIVPLEVIGPHLKFRAMTRWDEELMEYTRKGYVYTVPENVIFNYEA